MPIFEYRCKGCGEHFDILVTSADHTPPECPRCGAVTVERMLSAFAVGKAGRDAAPGPCGSADCACRAHDR